MDTALEGRCGGKSNHDEGEFQKQLSKINKN
jgi:hypothetical protein